MKYNRLQYPPEVQRRIYRGRYRQGQGYTCFGADSPWPAVGAWRLRALRQVLQSQCLLDSKFAERCEGPCFIKLGNACTQYHRAIAPSRIRQNCTMDHLNTWRGQIREDAMLDDGSCLEALEEGSSGMAHPCLLASREAICESCNTTSAKKRGPLI